MQAADVTAETMPATEAIQRLKEAASPEIDQLTALTRQPTLSDLIRIGSTVTDKKTNGWGDGNNTACALSAAEIGRQYLSER